MGCREGRRFLLSCPPPPPHTQNREGLRPRLPPPPGIWRPPPLRAVAPVSPPGGGLITPCAFDGLKAHLPFPLALGPVRLAYCWGLTNLSSGGLTFRRPSDLSSNLDLTSALLPPSSALCLGCSGPHQVEGQALGQL